MDRNKYLTMILAAVSSISATGCVSVTTERDNVTKTIEIKSGFNRISSDGYVDVEYCPGEYSLELEAPKTIIDNISVNVTDSCLHITAYTVDIHSADSKNITIGAAKAILRVTAPDVSSFSSMGSGDMNIESITNNSGLTISTIGSGNISCDYLKSSNIKISSQGSGDVSIKKMNAKEISVTSSGSGDFDCNLTSFDKMVIETNGSGDAKILNMVGGSITAVSSGSGDITLSGKCKLTEFNSGGSGEIVFNNKVME